MRLRPAYKACSRPIGINLNISNSSLRVRHLTPPNG